MEVEKDRDAALLTFKIVTDKCDFRNTFEVMRAFAERKKDVEWVEPDFAVQIPDPLGRILKPVK